MQRSTDAVDGGSDNFVEAFLDAFLLLAVFAGALVAGYP